MSVNYNKLSVIKLEGTADISSPLSVTTSFGKNWVLSGVYLKFSNAVTEVFTVTFDSGYSSNCDCVFKSENLSGATSASYLPSAPLVVPSGSEINVSVTSATATGTVGYTIVGYEI